VTLDSLVLCVNLYASIAVQVVVRVDTSSYSMPSTSDDQYNVLRANITNILMQCELQMTLGLLIFSLMEHFLVNLSDERLSFLKSEVGFA
jgi:hypothetical protein